MMVLKFRKQESSYDDRWQATNMAVPVNPHVQYYVYFLYSYFQFRIIFTCQTSMPEFRWHNQSEFGDII